MPITMTKMPFEPASDQAIADGIVAEARRATEKAKQRAEEEASFSGIPIRGSVSFRW